MYNNTKVCRLHTICKNIQSIQILIKYPSLYIYSKNEIKFLFNLNLSNSSKKIWIIHYSFMIYKMYTFTRIFYFLFWLCNDIVKWITEYSWLIKRPMSNVCPCRNLYLRNLTMGITCNLFAVSRGARISNQRNIDFVFDTNTPNRTSKVVFYPLNATLFNFLQIRIIVVYYA